MKIEVIMTRDDGTVERGMLFKSENWPVLLADLAKMKGINVYQEFYNALKHELKQFLRYKADLSSTPLHDILGPEASLRRIEASFNWDEVK